LKHRLSVVCDCVPNGGIKSLALVYLTHSTINQKLRTNSKLPRAIMSTVLLLLLFLALPVLPARGGRLPSLHLELARADALAAVNLTDHELLRRAVQRSLDRVAGGVVVGKVAVEAPLAQGGGEYLVKVGIGTPQQVVSAAIDTATDLVWMQCQPCVSCYRQVDPVFNPKLSSSFAFVPCGSDTCGQLDEQRYVPRMSTDASRRQNRGTNERLAPATGAATKTTTTRASTRTSTAGTR
jgi:hypothetical protein